MKNIKGMRNLRRGILRLLLLGLLLGLLPASGLLRARAQSQSPTTSKTPTDSGQNASPQGVVPEKNQEEKDTNEEYYHSATVVKIGSLFGMGPEAAATAFTVFNFVILAVGVGVLVVRIVPKAMRERSTRIQKQLVEARTATEEANTRLNAVESRLSKLDEQIAAMRADAETASQRETERLHASVEEEKAKILAAADAEISAATATARRQLQQHAAELAIEHAARKLTVNAETDRALIANFARELGNSKGGQN